MSALCPYLRDSETQQHLRQKVNRLKRQARCHCFDEDDLYQHLTWAIQRAWHQYDPSRQSWYPFLRMILAREAATLVRSWKRQKRQGSMATSEELDAVVESGRLRHRHVHTLAERERLQLRLDIMMVVARLPQRLRHVAEVFPEHTISSLARELQVDRGTIRTRLAQLRRLFEKAHLQDYLDPTIRDEMA